MKTTFLKIAFIVLLSFTLAQNSDAAGRFFYRACAPRFYVAPAYCGPRYVPAPYYGRVCVPGHFIIDRWGRRVWVRPFYR